jgi:hypothetical protein
VTNESNSSHAPRALSTDDFHVTTPLGHCNEVGIMPLIGGRGVGRILGVGSDLGVGVTLGVGLGVAVAVAVGVNEGVDVVVGVGLGVALGVAVAVGVGEGVSVAVGVGVAPLCTSKEPISIRLFTTRSKPGPRWSNNGGGVKFGSPASMAGLPGKSSCVNVGPPLSCNCPSNGSVLTLVARSHQKTAAIIAAEVVSE